MAVRNTGERVRVFIGSEPKTEVARKVLECSITRRTEMRVDFTPLLGRAWDYSHAGVSCGTGFSLRRWMIPAFCNWQGRAIYLDADQLVLGDIWDLWTQPEQHPQPGASAWCVWQGDSVSKRPWPNSSVMVIDCAAAKEQWGWHLDKVLSYLKTNTARSLYHGFMHGDWMAPPPGRVDAGWNHLDKHIPGETKLLHYTSMSQQPWRHPAHGQAGLWTLELSVAIHGGFVTQDDLRGALDRWRPGVPFEQQEGIHPDYERFLAAYKQRRRQRGAD